MEVKQKNNDPLLYFMCKLHIIYISNKIIKYLGSSNNSNTVQVTLNEKDQKGLKVSSVEKQVSK